MFFLCRNFLRVVGFPLAGKFRLELGHASTSAIIIPQTDFKQAEMYSNVQGIQEHTAAGTIGAAYRGLFESSRMRMHVDGIMFLCTHRLITASAYCLLAESRL